MICNTGIGLFAVCELPTRTLIGYYCSVLVWHSSLKLSYNEWFDHLYLSHPMICNTGIGLFAVCELPTRTLIGYYCSVLVWHSSLELPYNEYMVIEPLDEFLMQDSTREWVTVSPGSCGEPSLYMGFQFMNDVGLSFDDQTDNQSQVCHAMYSTQITEDSCVYTTRMIVKGMELLCAYVQE